MVWQCRNGIVWNVRHPDTHGPQHLWPQHYGLLPATWFQGTNCAIIVNEVCHFYCLDESAWWDQLWNILISVFGSVNLKHQCMKFIAVLIVTVEAAVYSSIFFSRIYFFFLSFNFIFSAFETCFCLFVFLLLLIC